MMTTFRPTTDEREEAYALNQFLTNYPGDFTAEEKKEMRTRVYYLVGYPLPDAVVRIIKSFLLATPDAFAIKRTFLHKFSNLCPCRMDGRWNPAVKQMTTCKARQFLIHQMAARYTEDPERTLRSVRMGSPPCYYTPAHENVKLEEEYLIQLDRADEIFTSPKGVNYYHYAKIVVNTHDKSGTLYAMKDTGDNLNVDVNFNEMRINPLPEGNRRERIYRCHTEWTTGWAPTWSHNTAFRLTTESLASGERVDILCWTGTIIRLGDNPETDRLFTQPVVYLTNNAPDEWNDAPDRIVNQYKKGVASRKEARQNNKK